MTFDAIKRFEPFFGKWYIEEKLGEGSYGAVYKIKRTDYNEKEYFSALKVISIPKDEEELAETELTCGSEEHVKTYFEDRLKRFETEIELMNQFKGRTNIVSYEDHEIMPKIGQVGFDVFVRMELLEDVKKIQRTNPKLLNNQIEIIRIGKDICKALEICAAHNIIHRDIKPGNIMRSADGDYKLGDFGVARSLEEHTSLTRVGTRSFIAPEVELTGKYDARVDIYSLGMVLYVLLNDNRGPFLPDVSQKITTADQEQARERRMQGEALPLPCRADERLGAVVNKACAFYPDERYQTPAAFREALEEVERVLLGLSKTVAPIGLAGSQQEYPVPAPEPVKKSKTGLLAGMIAAMVVVVAGLSVGVFGMQRGWFSSEEQPEENERESETRKTRKTEKTEEASVNDLGEYEDDVVDESEEAAGEPEDAAEETGSKKAGQAAREDDDLFRKTDEDADNDLVWGNGGEILGASTDKAIHQYEIVMADVTWEEAFLDSQKYRGGYLVHIDSKDEFNYIVDLIENSGIEKGIYWIGGRRFGNEEAYYWVDTKGEAVGESLNGKSHWLAGEPSLESEGEAEHYMNMFYVKKEERYIWNDTSNDVIAIVPSYSGRVGYIVEIED